MAAATAPCSKCGKLGSFKCAKCKQPYCSKLCQTNHWPTHKPFCVREEFQQARSILGTGPLDEQVETVWQQIAIQGQPPGHAVLQVYGCGLSLVNGFYRYMVFSDDYSLAQQFVKINDQGQDIIYNN